MSNKQEYGTMSLATDIIICSVIDGELKVLLVKRNREPCKHKWGLVGGFVSICPRDKNGNYKTDSNGNMICNDETITEAAERIIDRDLGITNVKVNLFKIYDDKNRDKRSDVRIMSACHYVMIADPKKLHIYSGDSIVEYKWVTYNTTNLPSHNTVAFDHRQMLLEFRDHIKQMFRDTSIAFDLVGDDGLFTIPQMKSLYEFVYGRAFTNFSRYLMNRFKMISMDKKIHISDSGRIGRPAMLYKYLGPIDDI
jgi:ADP-ribose pyrophosphatase YjhB (NUDIX family)